MVRCVWAFALLLLIGCGESDAAPSSKPLTGTIEGEKFDATNAFALVGTMPSDKFIVIRSKKSTCADLSSAADGDLLVTFQAPWTSGKTVQIGGEFAVTLAKEPDKILAVTGEIEVLHAPNTIGSTGVLRLLADFDDTSKVDGQFDAIVCQ